ncbi:MAG: 2-oxoisovalerate dehydrogenase [Candidatus Fraserbacteria bacterium RBG_16_55_9]|uniref:2-oxoisovalerate dehydrogenase n=1 Tax=Fraserbacteria sp. (strain RBG_16_55_9) TaxID=1817864 RepID=A0A1F5UNG5_FRAXR|nr:MAG: 2-oxoisovalerate dehydrogenase [Candidatus Fraserbacteria bacterium RBG_16_55_9]
MPQLNLVQAINDALKTEMRRDDRVLVMGEDVGVDGGVFRATEGLFGEFGPGRAIDTPLAESGILGTALGMAVYGLRPVAEIQFDGFLPPAFDQIVSHAARLRWRSRGRFQVPLVVRAPYGGGIRALEHHSESPEAYYAHTPGLKVVLPSSPYEAKGLLIASIRDPDPVIFFEPKRLYRAFREEVPEGDYTIPLGKARVARDGSDVTAISWGSMTRTVLQTADEVHEKDGISVEVIDLRTLVPLDFQTVAESIRKTGRAVVVQEAPRTCGFASEITALFMERLLLYLEAPVVRVTGYDMAIPYIRMEEYYLPDVGRVARGIRQAVSS